MTEYKSKSEMKRVEALNDELKAPRDFYITVNEDDRPTHIVLFEKRDDRKQIHVREVLPGPDYKEIAEGLMGAWESIKTESENAGSQGCYLTGKRILQIASAAIEAARQKGMKGE